jgi:heptose I phosphotransferase
LQTDSFLVTLALGDCEKLDEHLLKPMAAADRRSLIEQVALLTGAMHAAGFNHRDLYLCHFLRNAGGALYIVDLHRVQQRARVPERWLVKDLAALNYSARGLVSRTDRLRFFKAYLGISRLERRDRRFALKVLKKTRKMIEHNNVSPQR